MEARFSRLAYQLTSCPQPYPVASSVTHPECMVDCCCGSICKFGREFIQTNVVRMHQGIHVAECEQVMLGVEPKNFEHGLRPENASSGQIPIPKPAAASIERSIDTAAD